MKTFVSGLLFCCSFVTAIAQPAVTSFAPIKAKPGDAVTITGTGFNTTASSNTVFFGATKAAVNTASATNLTVIVPIGATYDYISVLNTGTGLSAQSISKFHPIYNPAKTGITATDFAAEVNFTSGTTDVAVSDLDGDGKPDLAMSGSGSATVLRNTAVSGSINSGSFAASGSFSTGSTALHLAIGDLDGDGKPDIVTSNYGISHNISVLRNTSSSGSISFAAKIDLATGLDPYSVALADIDGDGRLDIIYAYTSGYASVFRNTSTTGNISFAAKLDFTAGGTPRFVVTGDIDGDGKPDVAVANGGSNDVSLLRNTSTVGNISFAAKIDFAAGTSPYSAAIGDIDGDGKPDLAVANQTTNDVSVLRNTSTTGTISFAAKIDLATGTTPRSVTIGDLDGDGKPDIATANRNSNNVSVMRNTSTIGSISVAAKVDFGAGTSTNSIAIADLDGDGKPDIATANSSVVNCSVLRNTDIPLPVQLTGFTAIPLGSAVKISWNTAEENGIGTYEVQRSIDGKNFSTLATRKANNINNSNYTVIDENPRSGINWYRLYIRGKDGDNKYSSIVNVKMEGRGEGILVYPNPVAEGKINLRLNAAKGDYKVRLINSAGKTVWSMQLKHDGGSFTGIFSLPSIPKGAYIFQVSSDASGFAQNVVF
jgi:hypothetical protein